MFEGVALRSASCFAGPPAPTPDTEKPVASAAKASGGGAGASSGVVLGGPAAMPGTARPPLRRADPHVAASPEGACAPAARTTAPTDVDLLRKENDCLQRECAKARCEKDSAVAERDAALTEPSLGRPPNFGAGKCAVLQVSVL